MLLFVVINSRNNHTKIDFFQGGSQTRSSFSRFTPPLTPILAFPQIKNEVEEGACFVILNNEYGPKTIPKSRYWDLGGGRWGCFQSGSL
jgi:hypothetical protein